MSRKKGDGTGSIRQRSDGRWEARYSAGFNPKNGKQIRKSIYGKTRREVTKKLNQVLVDLDNGTYIDETNCTLSEWLEEWLDVYVRPNVKPYTLDSYTRICNNHIKPALGRIKLAELSPLQVQKFYNYLQDEKGLSAKMVKNVNGVLHSALDRAMKLEMLGRNVTKACILPKIQKKEIKPMEAAEISAFLEEIKGERFGIIYYVTLFTGMRQGEVLGLTWDCVDFERNTILVNKQLQKTQKVGGEYVLVPTKSSRSRMMTVAPSVMEMLKLQRDKQLFQQRRAGEAWGNEWNLVFTDELGSYLPHFTVYKAFKAVVTRMGMPEERFHDLRHSFAVISLESGDDIKTVQSNLGHATASFTLDVYGHVSQRMKQQSADRMEEFIQRTTCSA